MMDETGLGRFFSGFLPFPFSLTTNFIPPFIHTHLIHFISSVTVMVWQAWLLASLPFTSLQYRGFIASHPSTRLCVGHELRMYTIHYLFIWCNVLIYSYWVYFITLFYCFPLFRLFIQYILNCVHPSGTGASMRACHAAGPGSILGRVKFPGWGFFLDFSSPVRQMSGSFKLSRTPNIILSS